VSHSYLCIRRVTHPYACRRLSTVVCIYILVAAFRAYTDDNAVLHDRRGTTLPLGGGAGGRRHLRTGSGSQQNLQSIDLGSDRAAAVPSLQCLHRSIQHTVLLYAICVLSAKRCRTVTFSTYATDPHFYPGPRGDLPIPGKRRRDHEGRWTNRLGDRPCEFRGSYQLWRSQVPDDPLPITSAQGRATRRARGLSTSSARRSS
jgi:hypothetical protein